MSRDCYDKCYHGESKKRERPAHAHSCTEPQQPECKDDKEMLFNPCYGLQEIKRDLQNIQGFVYNIYCSNEQILAQTTQIEKEIMNPEYGLSQLQMKIGELQETVEYLVELIES